MGLNYTRNQAWREADARVVTNDVVSFGSGAKRYRVHASFRYVVEGQPHLVPVSFPATFASYADGREYANRYAPAARIRLLFDPANPERVLIDTGDKTDTLVWPLGFLVLGILASGVALFEFWRHHRALCPRCATSVELFDRFCWNCGVKLPMQIRKVQKLIR